MALVPDLLTSCLRGNCWASRRGRTLSRGSLRFGEGLSPGSEPSVGDGDSMASGDGSLICPRECGQEMPGVPVPCPILFQRPPPLLCAGGQSDAPPVRPSLTHQTLPARPHGRGLNLSSPPTRSQSLLTVGACLSVSRGVLKPGCSLSPPPTTHLHVSLFKLLGSPQPSLRLKS